MGKNALIISTGFVFGTLLGFAYGQKTRSRVGESVETQLDGGRLTVAVDVGRAAKLGFYDLLSG